MRANKFEMSRFPKREVSAITQDRLQRLSVYESILAILIDELFHDLEHGAEIEPGMLVAINMHTPNALHIVCSQSKGRLVEIGRQGRAARKAAKALA